MRKFETLNDDAQDHVESQVDLLLLMPEHRRARRKPLQLVDLTRTRRRTRVDSKKNRR
jgi:hypothetical protein